MPHTPSRRTFLKAGAAATLVAGLAPGCSTAPDARAAASGNAPARRWAVAVRDVMLRSAGKPDVWAALHEVEAEGVEVNVAPDLSCPDLFHPQRKYALGSADAIAALKDELSAQKAGITAFLMANQLEARPDEELAWMKKLTAAGAALGVKAIRIDVVPHKLKRDEFLPFAIKTCKQLAAIAADAGIRLGIENHGNTTNDPAFLEPLFAGAGAANLGLTLDTANFYWYGHPLNDLYGLYEKFASRVFHTHCKSIRYPEDQRNVRRQMGWEYGKYCCPIYEGDLDFTRIAAILKKAGYDGDLCVENESLGRFPAEQRGGILKKEVALLRGLAEKA